MQYVKFRPWLSAKKLIFNSLNHLGSGYYEDFVPYNQLPESYRTAISNNPIMHFFKYSMVAGEQGNEYRPRRQFIA